ncbi:MAG: deoxyribose-phosphate aldolase [Phycisphaerae bacterium]
MTIGDVAHRIDHTLLKPEATAREIDILCEEACVYGFKTVCVNPVYVSRAARTLSAHRTNIVDGRVPAVCSVAGFPLGACKMPTKADAARRALDDGAVEIDMVANIGALVDGECTAVRHDIEAVARAVHGTYSSAILKVILETAALTDEQVVLGCRCCVDAGADFVKTSTGFHPAGGATIARVRLLSRHAAPLGVKAAGGIRDAPRALAMFEAGADRLGASSSVAIIRELQRSLP